ncbi:MAG: flagellar FlbD family protein [bacterium]
MIILTRLNGQTFALNPHQIEIIEETPDTVVTLNSGQKYVVKEPLDKLIELIINYRKRLGVVGQEE